MIKRTKVFSAQTLLEPRNSGIGVLPYEFKGMVGGVIAVESLGRGLHARPPCCPVFNIRVVNYRYDLKEYLRNVSGAVQLIYIGLDYWKPAALGISFCDLCKTARREANAATVTQDKQFAYEHG